MSSKTNRSIRRLIGLPTFKQIPATITFTPTAGAANVCNVAIEIKNADGTAITEPRVFDVYLSDSSTGVGLTAVTASGTVTNKASSGVVFGTNTAKKALRVQSLATGIFTLEITDTAKTGFYVCVVDPTTGTNYISSQLVTANYG